MSCFLNLFDIRRASLDCINVWRFQSNLGGIGSILLISDLSKPFGALYPVPLWDLARSAWSVKCEEAGVRSNIEALDAFHRTKTSRDIVSTIPLDATRLTTLLSSHQWGEPDFERSEFRSLNAESGASREQQKILHFVSVHMNVYYYMYVIINIYIYINKYIKESLTCLRYIHIYI